MAVVVEELVSDLIVRDGRLKAGLNSAERVYNQSLNRMGQDTRRFESEFDRSSGRISDSMKRMAGVLAAGFTAGGAGQLIDGYTRLQNQLRVTGLEGERLAEVQGRLSDLAVKYGADIGSLATVYGRISIAAKELGADSEQILAVNEAVAAALRVSGTSASEASGALLQFSQAMGAGTVRAEEFNSLLEGAFPLVLAAANGIDRFGGSVAQLRAAVVDGTVSSREFFDGVLAGAPSLIEQAERANMTLAQSFTVLKDQLMLYVGEAASANGVTGALTAGITALANNLSTILPALAVIAAAFAGKFAASVGASTAALVAQTIAAQRAEQTQQFLNMVWAQSTAAQTVYGSSLVRTTGQLATLTGVASGAGSAMLAAFGGPVGLAITAVGLGLAYVASEAHQARAEAERLADVTARNEAEFLGLATATDKASGSTKSLSAEQVAAKASAAGLAIETDRLTDSKYRQAAATRAQAIEEQKLAVAQNARSVNKLANQMRPWTADNAMFPELGGTRGKFTEEQAREFLASPAVQAYIRSREALSAMQAEPITVARAVATAIEDDKKRAGAKTRAASGPSAAETADRAANELARLRQEEINAQLQLVDDMELRADLMKEILDEEFRQRSAQLANDQHFTAEQKKAQQDILNRLYGRKQGADGEIVVTTPGLYQQQINREIEREKANQDRELLGMQADAISARADIALTLEERRRLSEQALAIEQEIQRQLLEQAISEGKISDAAAARAALAQQQSAERTQNERRNQGAIGGWMDDRADPRARAEEAVVRKLDAVNQGITDALADQLGVKDQFIKELFSIFLDDVVFKPLFEALGKSQGGAGGLLGSVLGSIGGLFGGARAGGGSVQAGRVYRVNEGQQEFFSPATNGTVVPLSQMNAAPAGGGGGQPVVVQLSVAAGEAFVPMVEAISGNVSVRTVQAAAPELVGAAVTETSRRLSRTRM